MAALREHFGLERRPVKVHEPYQMLGLLEDDLQRAMGIDVEGVFPRNTMFGFPIEDWKPWIFRGIEVLVPGGIQYHRRPEWRHLDLSQGDTSVAPSGRMPKDGYFFDSIVRQKPIDEDRLDPADNLEEFTADRGRRPGVVRPLGPQRSRYRAGRHRQLRGHRFRRHRPGPGALPQGSRKESATWPSGTSRRAAGGSNPPGFLAAVRDRPGNLEKIRAAVGDAVDAVFMCGTDFGTQTSASVPCRPSAICIFRTTSG